MINHKYGGASMTQHSNTILFWHQRKMISLETHLWHRHCVWRPPFHLYVSLNWSAICLLHLLLLGDDQGDVVTYNLVYANAFNHIFVDVNAKNASSVCNNETVLGFVFIFHRRARIISFVERAYSLRICKGDFRIHFPYVHRNGSAGKLAHTIWRQFGSVSLKMAYTEREFRNILMFIWVPCGCSNTGWLREYGNGKLSPMENNSFLGKCDQLISN